MDVVQSLRGANADRDPLRLAMKYKNMRASPFVFLRGTCGLFYDRAAEQSLFTTSPKVWICGDLHFENFGSYKGDNRLTYFDINDFDESILAPLTWDVGRFLASLLTATEALKIDAKTARQLCQLFLDFYCSTVAAGRIGWLERETAGGLVGDLLEGLRSRKRKAFLDQRTKLKNGRRAIRCDGEHALEASTEQREEATELIKAFAKTREKPKTFTVLDVANRIAGTGSLGVERYCVLVQGKGSPDGNVLLDLKLSQPSSLLPHAAKGQPVWPSEAARVTTLQRRLQAVPPSYLHALTSPEDEDRSFVLRELQLVADRVALGVSKLRLNEMRDAIAQMARLTAWAHLRSTGRQGAAIADDLTSFAKDAGNWQSALLKEAVTAATQVTRDWKVYAKAYDKGAFGR